ncbi:hypothetical protein XENOCAPTIV_005028, partial [Xenoophorus captivus]
DSIHTAFDSAKVYSHTFDHFLAFSKNNENLDLDAVWELETGNLHNITTISAFVFHLLLATQILVYLTIFSNRKQILVNSCFLTDTLFYHIQL